jgi:hypothetical protein
LSRGGTPINKASPGSSCALTQFQTIPGFSANRALLLRCGLRLQVTLRTAQGSATLGERQHLRVESVDEALLIRTHIRELAVFEADDVGGDPGSRAANSGETSVRDDVVALGEDYRAVSGRARTALAAGPDMGAVLNISIGPVAFRTGIIAPVEKRIECRQGSTIPSPGRVRSRNDIAAADIEQRYG